VNFDITYQLIVPLLQWIVEITHSYGWAIILLTIAFRLLVSPLVTQTTVSMRRMSKLQPQMKAIQERYKSNPEQLQKKLVEFYKKNKVNPFGGCLPTLVQLPLLFALYAAFAGPPFADKIIDVKVNAVAPDKAQVVKADEASGANSIYVSRSGIPAKVVVFPGNSTIVAGSDLTFGVRATDGKLPADFLPQWRMLAPKEQQAKETQSVEETTSTNNRPTTTEATNTEEKSTNETAAGGKSLDQVLINANGHATFPVPGEYHVQAVIPGIAKNESFAFISGLGKVATGAKLLKPANFDIVFLVLLFGVTMFLSQKLTVPTPKPAQGQELDEQQIIQQQTMKTMPFVTMIMFFFIPLPAGVYLYLVMSNVLQTFQTWLIARMPEPDFGDEGDSEDIPIGPERGGGGEGAMVKPNKNSGTKGNGQQKQSGNNSSSSSGTLQKSGKKKNKRKR